MNCQHCNKHMYSYYDSELAPLLKQEIERHLSQCSFCRSQYDLTLMENAILLDTGDIPELSPDFNQRVMDSIASCPIQVIESFSTISKNTKKAASRRWPIFRKAAAAVVLLALCMYIPGIIPSGQEKLAQKTDSHKIHPVKEKVQIAATGSVNNVNNAKQLPEPQKQINEAKTPAPLPVQPDTFGQTGNVENPQVADTLVQTDRSDRYEPEVGRSLRSMKTSSVPAASAWTLQNIPANYQLQNVKTKINQTEYSYLSVDGTQNLNIAIVSLPDQTSKVLVGTAGVSNSEPPAGVSLAGAKTSDSTTREIQIGNETIKIFVSGSLSNEELNKIASSIDVVKNP